MSIEKWEFDFGGGELLLGVFGFLVSIDIIIIIVRFGFC